MFDNAPVFLEALLIAFLSVSPSDPEIMEVKEEVMLMPEILGAFNTSPDLSAVKSVVATFVSWSNTLKRTALSAT
jgi:hypothetical protein